MSRQNRADVGRMSATGCCIAASPAIQPFRANELRGSNSLHFRFDNTPPKLAPYIVLLCRGEFIVFGRCSALSGRLLGARPWLSKRRFWDFPPLLALKRRWTLFAFPRRIIQRPSEMTGRAVPAAIPVKVHTKA
jgi:hypothetical protein